MNFMKNAQNMIERKPVKLGGILKGAKITEKDIRDAKKSLLRVKFLK